MNKLVFLAMLIIVILVVAIFLYFALVALLNWWFGKTRQNNPATTGITKAGLVFYALMILLLLAGILVGAFAPDTWMGGFYKAIGELSGWSFLVTVFAYLAGSGLQRLGIEFHYLHVPRWDAHDPVKDWRPIEDEKELAPGSVYAIEFQNDNKTRMDFVFSMFVRCFGMKDQDAYREMMAIHEQGSTVVGSMSRMNAEALVEHIQAEAGKR